MSNIILAAAPERKIKILYFKIDDKFFITSGNAGNILVTIGNKIMGKLGEKGEVLDSIIISPNYFLN